MEANDETDRGVKMSKLFTLPGIIPAKLNHFLPLLYLYSLVRKVLADQEVPGKNIGSNKCTGTSVCRKSEVQIFVPVHELSPDFC